MVPDHRVPCETPASSAVKGCLLSTTQIRESGFVLIATIWFVALLALVAVIIGGWISRSLGHATALTDRSAARGRMISALNETVFAMMTGYYSPRGLEIPSAAEVARASPLDVLGFVPAAGTPFVALDDRPYRLGPVVVRLQDERGLYNLNVPDPAALDRLLRLYGINYDGRGPLIDRLLDYMDKSELSHLNGAVAADYAQAGRPAPRGAPLLTPWEAWRVLGWDDYPQLWRGSDALPQVATVGYATAVNPNTAPAPVLRSLPGMDERAAERVIDYRALYPIENPVDLTQAAGVQAPSDPMTVFFFPSGNVRVTLLSEKSPLAWQLLVRRTPTGKRPYRIDYAVEQAQTAAERALLRRTDLPALPLPTILY
jgi:general secretion pathway protein K